MLAGCLFGMLASSCSLSEPAPKDFALVSQHPAKAAETGNTLGEAEAACKEETKSKGIRSVLAIFSRLRKGSADEDYIACMERRSYAVKQ